MNKLYIDFLTSAELGIVWHLFFDNEVDLASARRF